MATDEYINTLCCELTTIASALRHQRFELGSSPIGAPISEGLRDTLLALIGRNSELIDTLTDHLEKWNDAKP